MRQWIPFSEIQIKDEWVPFILRAGVTFLIKGGTFHEPDTTNVMWQVTEATKVSYCPKRKCFVVADNTNAPNSSYDTLVYNPTHYMELPPC